MNGLVYITSSGRSRRMLPKDFPPMTMVKSYIYAWRDDGLWLATNHTLVMATRELESREASPTADVIDSQSVKTTESGGVCGYDAGKSQRTGPVLVLHERKARATLAARLTGKGAAETASVIMPIFKRLDPRLRKSVTFGNGGEFARNGLLRGALNMATYFCDAYASWQKGAIENANGRLRRWFPRQATLDDVSNENIQEIIMTCNLTP